MEESLILVDHNDQQIGTGLKLPVHREGLLHRAFSLFIFDRHERLLLQQRAQTKYHSAGLWTNSCCGHPRPGESTAQAAHRRLEEEMGFDCPLEKVATLIYKAQVPGDLVEHEFDHIYIGRFDGDPQVNPDEASHWRWIETSELLQWIDTEPEAFTTWFKTILNAPTCQLEQWKSRANPNLQIDPVHYQDQILAQVSRTFALTIPQLPAELYPAVTNAYLLCRIADTIEDEPGLTAGQKRHYENAYLDAVSGRADAQDFSDDLSLWLTDQTLQAERDLVRHLPQVLAVHHTLKPSQRAAIVQCLSVMSRGMSEFQENAGLRGLATHQELDRYCYCVAGVVGTLLTELFIDFDPTLLPQRENLHRLALSFGTGLQLTNIVKDQWDDRQRGACWLPRDLLAKHGVQLAQLNAGQDDPHYAQALAELIGTAHSHLQRALQYTLLIPARHTGIRRFNLWTIGLALLTLRHVHKHPARTVKVSHAEVAWIMRLTRMSQRSDLGLRMLYKIASRKLPMTPLGAEWQSPPCVEKVAVDNS
ncbi:isopentenyl-diphosphate Delta-isomerase [Pseudomonas frederiksbergensis]|uniref:isopentenyl-diphosphate Delta-isomerase n=1 Tax=Pseudomonas frederiksbergensis TaxID=104087 RepID=UPI003D050393